MLRSEAIAATRGHRLHSIGVTWSDDADAEASLLLKSLTDSGFGNVVPVRFPEATEALARGIAEVIGFDTTAVCIVEPETVITLIVHTRDGSVQTAINHAIDSDERLIRWLSGVFTRADWRPKALVVVGSGGGLDDIMPALEDALSVPVFAPAEAGLALARGAALASTQNTDLAFTDDRSCTASAPSPAQDRRRRPLAQSGPVAMLAAGAVTFVVSVSIAVSMQIAPKRDAVPAELRRGRRHVVRDPGRCAADTATRLPSPLRSRRRRHPRCPRRRLPISSRWKRRLRHLTSPIRRPSPTRLRSRGWRPKRRRLRRCADPAAPAPAAPEQVAPVRRRRKRGLLDRIRDRLAGIDPATRSTGTCGATARRTTA